MSQEQFAVQLGGTKRGIQENEQGNTSPNSKLLAALAKLGLNINWLLTGEGQMYAEDLRAEAAKESRELTADEVKVVCIILMRLQDAIRERGVEVPVEKQIELVSLLFDYAQETGEVEQDRVERYLRLVA